MLPELTQEEWRYISVLIATDLRNDKKDGLLELVAMHRPTWEKIQPACQWDEEDALA